MADNTRLSGPAADNIRAIVELQRQAARDAKLPERISDAITAFAGSLGFVVLHLAAFAAWAAWNSWMPVAWRFDPYPFGLMTLFVSLEAVLVSTFVLIAQNRMTRQTEQRDHLNLQIDLLAEQEMTLLLRMIRQISERLNIPPESADAEKAEELTEQTNVYDLMHTIKKEMPSPGE